MKGKGKMKMTTFNRKVSVELMAFALTVLMAGNLSATDYSWSQAADGQVSSESNWTPEGVPTSSDTVTFDREGSYCVTETEDRSLGAVAVTNAAVTVDLSGKTWTVTGSWLTYNLTWDNATTLTTISNGTLNLSATTDPLVISTRDGTATKGNLRITGENTKVSTKGLLMGGTKSSFVLDGGASCDVAGEVVWGGNYGGGANNTVLIKGEGTSFRQSAAASMTGNIIGDNNKYIIADGADAYFTSSFNLSGGYGGRWNELWITNGASVVFGNGFWVAASANGRELHQNVCTIAGENTQVTVSNGFHIATSAVSNILYITDHAVVTHTVASGATSMYLGWDDSTGGNELRVEGGAKYQCLPSPTASYHSLYLGAGSKCSGNRIFVGADSTFEIQRGANQALIGRNGSYNNGIVVSNGTFNVTTSWPMEFGTSNDESTACGSGNYVEFYGEKPLAYMGALTFNTGSKLIYHVAASGYAAAPMNFRYKAANTSTTPAQLVLDVTEWCPEKKATIPLAVTMNDGYVTTNKTLLEELRDNVSIEGTKYPDWYSVSLSSDNKTLQLTCKPMRGLAIIVR